MTIIVCMLVGGIVYLGYRLYRARVLIRGLTKTLASKVDTIAEQKKLITGQGIFIQKYTDELNKMKEGRDVGSIVNSKISVTSFDLANMLGEVGRVGRFIQ